MKLVIILGAYSVHPMDFTHVPKLSKSANATVATSRFHPDKLVEYIIPTIEPIRKRGI